MEEPTLTHYHPKFIATLGFSLGDVHAMGLEKCIRTCIHHYSITQNSFTALKSSVLYLFILLSPQSLATTDVSTASIVLLFPECHTVGVIQYATFSEWLLSFSNKHFSLDILFVTMIFLREQTCGRERKLGGAWRAGRDG